MDSHTPGEDSNQEDRSFFRRHYASVRYPLADSANQKGLRRAQFGAISAVNAHFSLRSDPAILVMPTGTGKTAVLMMAPFTLRANRVLVITPSRPVRHQLAEGFRNLELLKDIGVLPGSLPSPRVTEVTHRIATRDHWEALRTSSVVVAAPPSVSPAITGVAQPPPGIFDLILIDESHHSPAETWNAILTAFSDQKRLLVTATPFRRDNREINGKLAYSYSMRAAVDDGIFGKINYRPVEDTGDADVDIAKAAAEVFCRDEAAGFKHSLMVRTDTRKRAQELLRVYEEHTALNLRLVDSSCDYGEVLAAIEAVRQQEIDGVVCVDMLGEGVDLPNLKIAAIHAPHRSLSVTLQFIGRFTRTKGTDIGDATFLAVPVQIDDQLASLYSEGAAWQELIPELAQARLLKEERAREVLDEFEPPTVTSEDLEDLSLYSLKPMHHVKVFRVREDVDLSGELELPRPLELVHRRLNPHQNVLVLISRQQTQPRWTNLSKLAEVSYDLFVLYYDPKAKLLLINASVKDEALYIHFARSFCSGYVRAVPLSEVAKVIGGLQDTEFYSMGLRPRLNHTSGESYRMLAGPDPSRSVQPSDARAFVQGHLFGRGTCEGEAVTRGYSSGGKVWSTGSSMLPHFVDWCDAIAAAINRNQRVVTGSVLDQLAVGEVAHSFHATPLVLQWSYQVYRKPAVLTVSNGSSPQTPIHLVDCELEIQRSTCTDTSLQFAIRAVGVDLKGSYALDRGELFVIENPKGEAMDVTVGRYTYSLQDYLNIYPPILYLADGAHLEGDQLFPFAVGGCDPFDGAAMECVDWKGSGVDIKLEVGEDSENGCSVHEHLRKTLPGLNCDLLFYDHGSGEIADYVLFTRVDEILHVKLFHCKGSKGKKAAGRLNDAYDVCGQAIKSICWTSDPRRLISRASTRLQRNAASTLVKGEKSDLQDLLKAVTRLRTNYEIVVVQPGLSRRELTPQLKELLAATSDYIRRAGCSFKLQGSD